MRLSLVTSKREAAASTAATIIEYGALLLAGSGLTPEEAGEMMKQAVTLHRQETPKRRKRSTR